MSSASHDHPPNRLAGESSPYLLLHRHNPVDWYPWGPEALERAKAEDRPIFLSVGYSTCYWCHVMERESFSDPETAALMNESFVNIKVDREERPDLDEIYMTATQVLAGQGGWPNSVFLTPDLAPYFAGTYFPPADAHGRPGFRTVLRTMRDAWHERRADVAEQAASVVGAIRHYLEERSGSAAAPPGPEAAARTLRDLGQRFDARWGGFGGAPKFPSPSNLLLLLELADDHPPAADMLATTLDRMARGGIYDQLGGGFHRYATDREWKVPHFEKMLYDNAWLLEVYARQAGRTGDPQAARVVRETAEFVRRELSGPEGELWSALDAETDGREGSFYVWTREELTAALGEEDATFLAPLYGFDAAPSFEGSHYVLHLPATLEDQAVRRRTTAAGLLEQMAPLRARLLAARAERPPLATDDKVLADWNGMAIGGLAVAGRILGDPALVERAAAAARFVLARMRAPDGTLLHAWRAGRGTVAALLGDYACLARGLLALHEATADRSWLDAAIVLTEEQIARLADGAGGGFWVAAESPDVLVRSKEVFDGAVPGANSLALLNLIRLAELTGEPRWRDLAAAGLRAFGAIAEKSPSAAPTLAVAATRFHRLAGGTSGAGGEKGDPEQVVLATLQADLDDAGDGEVTVRLDVAAGWHVYAAEPGDESLIGTRVEATGVDRMELDMPPGTAWQPDPRQPPIRVYQGTLELPGRVFAAREDASVEIHFQACDDRRCLAPATIRLALR
ncbi:MAG: DUF255 domain-containing protein [Acidobacteriota bacterium]|nr:DUF255 domain-containing protein [Acidobacteriota bacterium]